MFKTFLLSDNVDIIISAANGIDKVQNMYWQVSFTCSSQYFQENEVILGGRANIFRMFMIH